MNFTFTNSEHNTSVTIEVGDVQLDIDNKPAIAITRIRRASVADILCPYDRIGCDCNPDQQFEPWVDLYWHRLSDEAGMPICNECADAVAVWGTKYCAECEQRIRVDAAIVEDIKQSMFKPGDRFIVMHDGVAEIYGSELVILEAEFEPTLANCRYKVSGQKNDVMDAAHSWIEGFWAPATAEGENTVEGIVSYMKNAVRDGDFESGSTTNLETAITLIVDALDLLNMKVNTQAGVPNRQPKQAAQPDADIPF